MVGIEVRTWATRGGLSRVSDSLVRVVKKGERELWWDMTPGLWEFECLGGWEEDKYA
jgi:hypothetical protein